MSEDTKAKLAEGMPTDRTKYYNASQFGFMSGTIIPAAAPDDTDGRSMGLDHNKPLKVIVDEYRPDAFILDMSMVNDEVTKKAIDSTSNLSERLRIIKHEVEGNRKEEKENE